MKELIEKSDEILFYLNNHNNISNYVILDDNDLGHTKDNILQSIRVNRKMY